MSAEKELVYKKDWGKSVAKQQLKEDILSKRIEGWTPKQVYHDPKRYDLYKHYKYENFRNNLGTLRKSTSKGLNNSARDASAYEAYQATRPADTEGKWHRSPAQKLLRLLVKNKRIEGMKPQQIRNSSDLFD